jgi:protein gp37
LSLEPLIGLIDLSWMRWADAQHKPGWVIVGGESGPRARPIDIAWLESIADQCAAAGVPLFVKQDSGRKAGQQGRIPDELWRRKEFPNVSVKP